MNQAITKPAHFPQEFLQTLPEEENRIDFYAYWRIFSKHKFSIVGITVLVALIAGLVAYSLPTVYRATAVMMMKEDKGLKLVSIQDLYDTSRIAGYYGTQLQLLQSRELAEKVVNTLNLADHKAFDPAHIKKQYQIISLDWKRWLPVSLQQTPPPKLSEKARFNRAVAMVRQGLRVNHIKNTLMVHVSFESYDPKIAAEVPNALIKSYIENDLETKLSMTQEATSWLTERLGNLRSKLETSEKNYQDYLEQQSLLDVSGVKTVAAGQLQQFNTELYEARKKADALRNVYNQVQSLSGKPPQALEAVPAIFNDSLVKELKTIELNAERNLNELSKRYGDKHPSMITATSELASARKNLAAQLRRAAASIVKEYELAEANVRTLRNSVRQKENEIRGIGRKEYQLSVLEREAEVNRQLYDMFLTRLKETDVSGNDDKIQSTAGRIVDPALRGYIFKPHKKKIIIMAAIAGFIAAIGLAFLLEYLDNTIKHSDDVEQKLKLPLLGVVPLLRVSKKERNKPQLAFLDKEQYPGFVEAVRTIRTGIMLSGLDNPHKVLLITSAIPSEGKTTFSINQAFALGQVRKTLLIDADMRRPTVGKVFGFSSKAPGLSELVAGTQEMEECIHNIEGAGIDVLPSGQIPPNPLELLSSQRFSEVLKKLEERYEQIVIDSAPTHAVSDAMIIATHAGSVVFVVKADSTPYKLVKEGVKRLRQANINAINVVLNQINVQKLAKYYGKYGYSRYYGGSYYYTPYYGERGKA